MAGKKYTEEERIDLFWKKVDIQGAHDCWQWHGANIGSGYGQNTIIAGERYAHRISYTLVKGEIPEGLEIDHLCSNRKCVNPNHLEAVPRIVNIYRSSSTKLTPEQVFEILELSKVGPVNRRELADKYGVVQQSITRVILGQTFKHITAMTAA